MESRIIGSVFQGAGDEGGDATILSIFESIERSPMVVFDSPDGDCVGGCWGENAVLGDEEVSTTMWACSTDRGEREDVLVGTSVVRLPSQTRPM